MIGNKIFKLLESRKLSNIWLAEKLGTSKQYISSLLNREKVSMETLGKLSSAFDVPMEYWLDDKAPIPIKEDLIQKNADILFLQEQLIIEKQKVLELLGTVERLNNELDYCRVENKNLKTKLFEDAGVLKEAKNNPAKFM